MNFGTFRLFVPALCLAALAGACAPTPPAVPTIPIRGALTVNNLCSLGVSPAIEFIRLPDQAARISIRMQNIGVLYSQSQDFEIPAPAVTPGGGARIDEGALAAYRGYCPGERQTFIIRVQVLVRDLQGRPIASGEYQSSVTSTTRMIELQKRLDAGQPPAR